MNNIILSTGNEITLANWTLSQRLPHLKVGKHFTVSEFDCEGEMKIAEPLIKLLDHFRERLGKSVKINSGYRTEAKQKSLTAQGFKTATNSPHCKGMAADIDTTSWAETVKYVELLKECAKEKGISIRLGYNEYWKLKKQTFVHVDVCPMYYAKGRPFHNEKHPVQWERPSEW